MTNFYQARPWATRALPTLYVIDYAHAEAAAGNTELVAVMNLHAYAKTMRGFPHQSGCLYGSRKLIFDWVTSLNSKGQELDIHEQPWFKYYLFKRICY